jgi:hypothetical protein
MQTDEHITKQIREAISSHLVGLLHHLDPEEVAKNNGAQLAANYSLRLELAADFYIEEGDYKLIVSADLMGPALSVIDSHQVMLESVSVAGIGEDTNSIATAIKEVLIPDLAELVRQWPYL